MSAFQGSAILNEVENKSSGMRIQTATCQTHLFMQTPTSTALNPTGVPCLCSHLCGQAGSGVHTADWNGHYGHFSLQ